MFRVNQDGSVLDRDGKIVFFSLQRFTADIANGDCCFICGAQRGSVPFNNEHVIPDWLLRRFELHTRQIQMPNRTEFRYAGMTVPCCVTCNRAMGDCFETPISELFRGGFDAVSKYLKEHGPWRLFCWMALIFLKMHLKNKYLNFHRDRRKGEMKIAEIHSWDELFHLHCVARSFYSGADLQPEVLGSLCVFPAKVRPHFEGFDFIDLTVAQTMLLSVGDVAIVTVFNDSGAAMSAAFEDLQRIGGALSPIQLRELAARFASINLHIEPRPQFVSEIDPVTETYTISAEHPDQVHLPDWDDDLYGTMMHALSKDMIKVMRNGDEILNQVRTGRYTFLITPQGTFDADSMELEPETAPDPERL
jgi:hypothetical protein